jgi:hypothetical protein
MDKKSRLRFNSKKVRGISTESGPFLEPTHYFADFDGKIHYWSVKLICLSGINDEEYDKWTIEQIWGKFRYPHKQRAVEEFNFEVKAREKFDELVYSKKQEGFRPVFK